MTTGPEYDAAPAAIGAGVKKTLAQSQPNDSPLLTAALAYAARGWSVLPLHSPRTGAEGAVACSCGRATCESIGKHPRTSHGLKDASDDPNVIREWWSRWRDANVGVRTGASSGLLVLDIDPRHGGDDSLVALEHAHQPLPPTVRAETGGGGTHLLFTHPGGAVKSRSGAITDAPGIDCKSDGGYIVAPPSLHASGSRYRWSEKRGPAAIPFADPPEWLMALLRDAHRDAARTGTVCEPNPAADAPPQNASLSALIPEGKRSDTLTSIAGGMRRQGLEEDAIAAALLAVNARRCAQPLPEAEVRSIAASVAKYPPAETPGESRQGGAASHADRLVALALERYRIGRTDTDEPFATPKGGPNLARLLRSDDGDALKSELSRDYYRLHRKAPSGAAVDEALRVLQGMANEAEREPVALRLARHRDGIVLDLGDATGRAVVIEPGGWSIVDRSPLLFRRSALTGALPAPVRGGNLDSLRRLLNVTEETWRLVRGWLVAALLPDIPHPIARIGGMQGAGKSTAAMILGSLVDPSPAALCAPPRDPEDWMVLASASWAVALDNVSDVSEWWSDALCRAVTGDALVRRRRYSDSAATVLSFRRVVILTSIDAGAIRGDLGDRLLLLDLLPIDGKQRRYDAELREEADRLRPEILGAALDLLARTLEELPRVELAEKTRLADFERVLAAVDRVVGCDALAVYRRQRDTIAEEVVASDPVAVRLLTFMQTRGEWAGNAMELLSALSVGRAPKDWPRSPRGMSAALHRGMPALARVGVVIEPPTEREPGGARKRVWRMRWEPPTTDPTDPIVPECDSASACAGTVTGRSERGDRPDVALDILAAWDGRVGRDDPPRTHSPEPEFSSPVEVIASPSGALGHSEAQSDRKAG